MALTSGYETRTVAALAAELVSRAAEAMEIAAVRVELRLKESASKYTDSGEMERSISVTPTGGLSGFGGREVGMIASATAPHAEWVDKGTADGIKSNSTAFLPVGQRSPNRRNAPEGFKGSITYRRTVSGQQATHWFSAPDGIPLGEIMGSTYRGIFRRLR